MNKLENAIKSIDECKDSLEGITEHVDKLHDQDFETVQQQLSPLEHAKLNVGVAYSLASLLYISLKAKGVAASDHPVKEDLSRIKKYVEKIKSIEQIDKDGRKVAVDSGAARRIVSHQIASNKRMKVDN
mmetsp:Transcript_19898/g.28604  ORF Transcript_19898/g.28604 Transcript_19898/m.28604 type:complete len:129 (+) Transcript_19898:67-453(+)